MPTTSNSILSTTTTHKHRTVNCNYREEINFQLKFLYFWWYTASLVLHARINANFRMNASFAFIVKGTHLIKIKEETENAIYQACLVHGKLQRNSLWWLQRSYYRPLNFATIALHLLKQKVKINETPTSTQFHNFFSFLVYLISLKFIIVLIKFCRVSVQK